MASVDGRTVDFFGRTLCRLLVSKIAFVAVGTVPFPVVRLYIDFRFARLPPGRDGAGSGRGPTATRHTHWDSGTLSGALTN